MVLNNFVFVKKKKKKKIFYPDTEKVMQAKGKTSNKIAQNMLFLLRCGLVVLLLVSSQDDHRCLFSHGMQVQRCLSAT